MLSKLGDWLEMPKYGADGAVIDIGNHGKVRNWDNTITTIPHGRWFPIRSKTGAACLRRGGRRIKLLALILTRPVSIFWMMMKQRLLTAQLVNRTAWPSSRIVNGINSWMPESALNHRRMTNIRDISRLSERILFTPPSAHPRYDADGTPTGANVMVCR